MKLHINLILVLAALLINIPGTALKAATPKPIIDIQSFTDITDAIDIDKRTLVLLDLDNCCICPEGYEGSFGEATANVVVLIKHTAEALKNSHQTIDLEAIKHQSCSLAYEMFARVQKNVVIKTTHAGVLPFFQHLWAQTLLPKVIGFTSRRIQEANITFDQLHTQNLFFHPISGFEFKHEAAPSGLPCVAEYDPRGILFCGELNTKGDVFKKFFEKLNNEGFLQSIDTLVYVDDTVDHLKSVGQAFESMGLDLELYLYHYPFPLQVRKG